LIGSRRFVLGRVATGLDNVLELGWRSLGFLGGDEWCGLADLSLSSPWRPR
jgi:hypothetical protein